MVLGDDIDDKAMMDEFNIRLTVHGFQQGSFHFFPGYILMMQDPELRVPPFFSTLIIPVFFLIKLRSPVNNFLYSFRPFLHHNFHHFFIADTVTGYQRVFNMFGITVILHIIHHRNTALRIFGICFIVQGLGHDQYFPLRKPVGHFQGISQSGNS